MTLPELEIARGDNSIGRGVQAVVVGASAGAVDALLKIIPGLPQGFPAPLMIVVHVPHDRESILPELFQKKCPLPVREAADKEPIEKGTVYFAPPDYHLLVEQERIFSLSNEEPVLYSRPSIDVLFETAADAYREGLIGIVLTGANEDGARGLKAVIAAGGRGIVQRPEQAQSPTMPRAALAMNPAARPATLDEIVTFLKSIPS